MTRKNLTRQTFVFGLAAIVLAVVSIFWIDQWMANYFNAPHLHKLRVFCRRITDLGLGGPYFVAAAFVYATARIGIRFEKFKNRFEKTLEMLRSWSLMSFLSLTFVGISILFLKLIFGRQRPHLTPTFEALNFDPLNAHWNWHSFPSGHSQVILVVATCLSILVPKHRWFLFTLASLVAFTRVVTHQHFFSDVVVGSMIGYLGTLWVREWYMGISAGAPLRASLQAVRRDS